MAFSGTDKIGKELADALGLKHVRMLDFHIEANGAAIVTAELYPEIDGVRKFPAILKKYKLLEVDGSDNPGELAELGEEIASCDLEWCIEKRKQGLDV